MNPGLKAPSGSFKGQDIEVHWNTPFHPSLLQRRTQQMLKSCCWTLLTFDPLHQRHVALPQKLQQFPELDAIAGCQGVTAYLQDLKEDGGRDICVWSEGGEGGKPLP